MNYNIGDGTDSTTYTCTMSRSYEGFTITYSCGEDLDSPDMPPVLKDLKSQQRDRELWKPKANKKFGGW